MRHERSPWAWVPSLNFTEAVPYVAVMVIATVMYKRLGLSNTDIAIYTSWLYLPWTIKPFWSPIVDILRTKRWWILTMQALIGAAMAGVAFTIPAPSGIQLSLACFWLMAFSSATHDIAADGFYMEALSSHEQTFYAGIRSTAYRIATLTTQGAFIGLAGMLEAVTHRIAYSWSITFYLLAAFMMLLFAWHAFALPKSTKVSGSRKSSVPEAQSLAEGSPATKAQSLAEGSPATEAQSLAEGSPATEALPAVSRQATLAARHKMSLPTVLSEIARAFATFFRKPQILCALAFMLLYRLPEALLVKISPLFLIDPLDQGGMGLSTIDLGVAQGTVGIIGLTIGGILGGILAARYGFKRCLWPMVLSITLPDIVYVLMSYIPTLPFPLTCCCIFIEQFGYGFGFTAYMLYLLYFSRGEYPTAHYAFCTGFMALSMMLPGFLAGWLSDNLGYRHFFLVVMACCAVTFLVTSFLKIDPTFGQKEKYRKQDR
ncbi:MAG: MFS transporter [Bacteroidaceae bacterium]|nr:MFS transporter [Bacteroidaceae bacterium]